MQKLFVHRPTGNRDDFAAAGNDSVTVATKEKSLFPRCRQAGELLRTDRHRHQIFASQPVKYELVVFGSAVIAGWQAQQAGTDENRLAHQALTVQRGVDQGVDSRDGWWNDGHGAVDNLNSPLGKQLDGARVNLVFLFQDAAGERVGGIVGKYRNHGLDDDRPGIDTAINQVDSTAGEAGAVVDCLLLDMQPGKSGEQGRVDVDNPLREGVEHHLADDAHEAGQHHQLDTCFL